MHQINTIQFVVGILVTVGSVIFSLFKVYKTVNDRILVLENELKDVHEESDQINDNLKKIHECIFDIRTHQTEIRIILFGTTGNNGMNSNVKELKNDVKELRESLIELTTQLKHQNR